MKFTLHKEDVATGKTVTVHKQYTKAPYPYTFEIDGEIICLSQNGMASLLAILMECVVGTPSYKTEI